MQNTLRAVTLRGRYVRLEPLGIEHVNDLVSAASQDRTHYKFTNVPVNVPSMTSYVAGLLDDHRTGAALPFVQRRPGDDMVVGCTRFLEISW